LSASEIVNKVWNYAHVLRDDGVGYGDYVEQITYLIFLKMADERENAGQQLQVPNKYAWAKLVKLDGDDLELQYRHTLENLGKQGGILGTIIPQGAKQNPGPRQAGTLDQDDREGTVVHLAGGCERRHLRRFVGTQCAGCERSSRAILGSGILLHPTSTIHGPRPWAALRAPNFVPDEIVRRWWK